MSISNKSKVWIIMPYIPIAILGYFTRAIIELLFINTWDMFCLGWYMFTFFNKEDGEEKIND